MMSKIILFKKVHILIIALVFFMIPIFAGAQSGNQGNVKSGNQGGFELPNPLKTDSFEGLVQAVSTWLYTIMIPISAIIIMYAGFLFMTSGGEEEKVKKAKRALWWAVIGIAIIAINYGFVILIKEVLAPLTSQ